MTLVAAAVMVLVVVGGASYFLQTRPLPYPIPVGNVSVTLPSASPYRQLTTGNYNNDMYPVWSPNGSLIAYISSMGGLSSVWVVQASGTAAVQVSPPYKLVMYPEWSPDSSSISYYFFDGAVSGYEVVNLKTLSITRITTSNMAAFQGRAEWSPDGSHLAFFISGPGPQLIVYDMKTDVDSLTTDVSGPMLVASWVSNEELVYSSYYNGSTCIMWVSLLTEKSGLLMWGPHNFVDPCVGPNGTIAYYSDFNPALDSPLLQGSEGYMIPLPGSSTFALTPGGEPLYVFVPLNETSYDVWFSGVDGSNPTFQSETAFLSDGSIISIVPAVPGTIDLASPPAWSPDGTQVVYAAAAYSASSSLSAGEMMYLWNTVTGSISSLGPMQTFSFEPTWSPNGLNIAFVSNMTGTYHIWVLSTTGGSQGSSGSGY